MLLLTIFRSEQCYAHSHRNTAFPASPDILNYNRESCLASPALARLFVVVDAEPLHYLQTGGAASAVTETIRLSRHDIGGGC